MRQITDLSPYAKRRLNYYTAFNKIPHTTFALAFLPHSTQRMKSAHLISSHSIFCFLLVTQHVALGFLSGALFRPRCGDKIRHFLTALSSPHISTASKHFESINKLTYAIPLNMLLPSFYRKAADTQKDVAFCKGQNHIFRAHILLISV